ncbi:MAG: zinc-dependent metalloprotease [Roseateles sp.]
MTRLSRTALASAALIALATAQAQTPPAPNGAASAPAAAPARPPADPTAPKPFADVIKGAKEQPGLFPVWRKDEKVWIEIPKEQFNKPFLFSVNVANSIGERGLYASQMIGDEMVEWRRIGNQVQLIALNSKFRSGDPSSKLVLEQAFSPSLITAGPVASAEHPDRKSVLVDASALLLGDIPGYSTRLEAAYRLPYAPDRANSFIEASRADAQITTLTSRVHFATPRIPAPPLTPAPVPTPTPPQTTPDPRSMFFSFVYSFRALPEQPAAVRLADPRLGHFMESYSNLGEDTKANTRVHMVARWRLEKKDPAAALSEPVQPIVYWMDKNIPAKYREAVKAGILEWNKAFEKIGFKDAIQARQQPDDADWDNMDATHASVRWFTGADVGFAIGPSSRDPRTGEILDADIGMSDVFSRGARRLASDDVASHAHDHDHRHGASWMGERSRALVDQLCTYAADQANELGFALDLLALRDGLDMNGPEAEALAQAVVKDVIMHEVGHTLGLKHNFRSSTTVTQAQLRDKAWTEANGISNSVMDYNAYNLPLQGEPRASLTNTTLGAYDYWAIEYAYKPIPAAQEAAELARIAARSTEPQLAYGDDFDQGVGGPFDGFDPRSNQRDLGDDPLAYAKKRLKLSQELWERVQTRKPESGEDPFRARRSVLESFRQLGMTANNVSKYVGGLHAERIVPGVTPGQAFKPVDSAQQREALRFIATGLLSSNSFKFSPEFIAMQTLDYNEWEGRGQPLSIPDAVAALQGRVLDRLMSANTARRLIEQGSFLPEAQRKSAVSLSEVYATLQAAVFSELKTGAEIDRMRRSLQREYLKRLQAQLNRSTNAATVYADAFSMARWHATQLAADLRAAAAKPGLSVETRAHLAESLDLLNSMLKATLTRS